MMPHQWLNKNTSGRNEQIKRIRQLSDRLEPRLARRFLSSLEEVKDDLDFDLIESLIRDGRFEQIINLISTELIGNGLSGFSEGMSRAFVSSGVLHASFIQPFRNADNVTINIVFDQTNPELFRVMNQYKLNRIREITADTVSTVRDVLTRNVIDGVNPNQTAREIREVIGLTQRQELAVLNYRRYLESLDPRALARQLRDKRFDRTVVAAIRDDKPLAAEQINKMVSRYRQRYLNYRARTIARTESIRALSLSNQQIWVNAVEEGKIEQERIRRFWVATADGRTRDHHRNDMGVPSLNKDGVGLFEPFKSSMGPIMYPGDPNAPAANSINCRCSVFTRIVSNAAFQQSA